MAGTAAAFFDVDETLIRVKSMFRFLEFYLRRRGEPAGTYRRLTDELRAAAAGGLPRHEVNRRYYRLYAGEEAGRLTAAGADWFAAELAEGLFVPETVEALDRHRAAGETVLLLSGSFFACLEPIAAHLSVHGAIGTRPVVRHGRLTGEVVTPMIGPAKAAAARAAAGVLGLDLAASTGYGDHSSDLDLLRTVGRAVVVGDDPRLTAHAARFGWSRLLCNRPPADWEPPLGPGAEPWPEPPTKVGLTGEIHA
ncbi:HAD family hydrolase [Kitasatospora sp. NPDC052896]|uniref:HAD family hydrolase n=1 Tax=Kitasatospora sp. NPDC052896 TaxID=3364061 RepID=UPI0037C8D3DA